MTTDQLWQATLGELELQISKVHFTTWFRNTFIVEWVESKVIVAVPNNFTKAWLENKYHKSIIKVLQDITENKINEVVYKVETTKKVDSVSQATTKEDDKQDKPESLPEQSIETQNLGVNNFGINTRYVFNNFVVGKGNELAYAASLRVAQEPGKKYNPLFLYGDVGLGKTHLLQAVGNELLKTNPNLKLVYVTSEQFTNDYVGSIKSGATDKFKNKYRSADLLLIDDIQFIAGKEQTQEEFFHTFNVLRDNQKQIVLTSDRPPKAIPALEERLISRFEWGMIVDISSPDLETRMAILQSKSQEKGLNLGEDILRQIAINVQSNVRELEGALNKLVAHCELHGIEPSEDTIRDLISSISINKKRGGITSKELMRIVVDYFEISFDDLIGQSRRKELVVPRQITMFLMREELDSSYPTIGQEMGGRDHTTAMHAYTKIKRDIDAEEKTRQDINLIKQRLYNS